MNLRDYISEHDTSSAELAARIGVTKEALRRYATGERTPRPDTIRKIMEATGGKVGLADLVQVGAAA